MIRHAALAGLAAIAIAAVAPAAAQDVPRATLTAAGQGVASAPPDVAIITFGVSSRAETPGAALAANNADMRKVVDATLAAGVAPKDVATTAFSINPVYADPDPVRPNQPARIVAYDVRNEVTARVHGISTAPALLDQVVTAGANAVTGISFDIDDPQEIADRATRDAIAEARRKAEVIAVAAGVTLGRLMSVSTGDGGPQPYPVRAYALAATPILGGEQSVTVTATLVFEIAE